MKYTPDKKAETSRIIEVLKAEFPDKTVYQKTKNLITVRKNRLIGSEVYNSKSGILLKPSWASSGARIIFYLLLIILGIIIPLIIFYIFVFPKMRNFNKRVYKIIEKHF